MTAILRFLKMTVARDSNEIVESFIVFHHFSVFRLCFKYFVLPFEPEQQIHYLSYCVPIVFPFMPLLNF